MSFKVRSLLLIRRSLIVPLSLRVCIESFYEWYKLIKDHKSYLKDLLISRIDNVYLNSEDIKKLGLRGWEYVPYKLREVRILVL